MATGADATRRRALVMEGMASVLGAGMPPAASIEVGDGTSIDVHATGAMPAPLHRRIEVAAYFQDARSAGIAAADAIAWAREHPPRMSDELRERVERLERTLAGTGARIVRWAPHSLQVDVRGVRIGCRALLSYVDHGLAVVERVHAFGDVTIAERRQVAIMAKAQRARREASGRGFTVDAVLGSALARLTRREADRLVEILRDPNPDAAPRHPDNWTPDILRERGVRLPEDVETLRVRNGVIVGRVRLSGRTTWHAGTLLHRGDDLPGAALQALAGRPVSDLLSATHMPSDATITSATVDGAGALRVKATVAVVPFPARG